MNKLSTCALFTLVTPAAFAFGFSDIQFWTGSGSNESALVVDWNDGKATESLAWGFRWDGSATGIDLLHAIDAADARLSIEIVSFSFGDAVRGFAYDADLDGLYTGADDHFAAGFGFPGEGYWGYYIAAPTESNPSWGFSGVGPSDRALANQSWDGWSWTPSGGNDTFPSVPTSAPVPEPATLAALGFGALALMKRRRR
jgi:hypothetical protein